MSDETKLRHDIGAGARAAEALETLGSVLDALEADYVQAWKGTPARDQDARERLFLAVQIVGKVRTHLSKSVENGKLAAVELDEIRRFGEKRKRFGIV